MKAGTIRYIADCKGKRLSVISPLKDYKLLLAKLEELEDIRMYDEVNLKKKESTSFKQYLKQRKK